MVPLCTKYGNLKNLAFLPLNVEHILKEECVYLAFVLLVPHPEFDVRVAEAIGIHGLQATTFYQTDADYTSPQLGFSVHI